MLRFRREPFASTVLLWLFAAQLQWIRKANASDTGGRHMFCYYSSSSHLRPDAGKFLPENIDPTLCSHVIFAFADLVKGTTLQPGNVDDLDKGNDPGLYNRTLSLRRLNPSLKVLLAVGGWRAASAPFVEMIKRADNRRSFLKNAVRYLRRHGFDGLDVDWEFPGTRGSDPGDRILYTGLLKDIRETFDREAEETGNRKLLLTIAVSGGSYYINLAYEPKKIVRYVDYLLIMAYNYHGSWNEYTGHHSALYPRSDEVGGEREWNQAWSIDFWLSEAEAPRSKVILGLATYGMTFTLSDPDKHGMKAAASGAGNPGRHTQESGTLAYYEICENLKNGWTDEWEDEQKVPFAYYKDQWVGYDNPRSLTLKVQHLLKKGLGGAFIWSLDMDDFRGSCGNGKYPLLSSIVKALDQGVSDSDPGVGADPEKERDRGQLDDRTGTDPAIYSARGRGRPRHDSPESREDEQSLPEARYSGGREDDGEYEDGREGGKGNREANGLRKGDSRRSNDRSVAHLNPRSLSRKPEVRDRMTNDDVIDYESKGRRLESTGDSSLAHPEESGDRDKTRPIPESDRLRRNEYHKTNWFNGVRSSLQQRSRLSHDLEPREASNAGSPSTADGSQTCYRSGVFPDPESCHSYYICVPHETKWYKVRLDCPRGLGFKSDVSFCEKIPGCE